MEEIGTIVEVSRNTAKVKLEANEQCGHCEARIFCHPGSHNDRHISAMNNINAKINDKVIIGISPGISTFSTCILFIVPILVFIGMFVVIKGLTHNENFAILGGFIGLILFFGFLVIFNRKIARNKKFYPVIKEILE